MFNVQSDPEPRAGFSWARWKHGEGEQEENRAYKRKKKEIHEIIEDNSN